jgi:hypothetical protein
LAKGLEDGVMTAGDEASEKEGGAHGLAAAGDMALPFDFPDWRANGASPARLAIRLPSRVPSSGSSAMSLQAVIGPTPGTEARRSSFLAPCG